MEFGRLLDFLFEKSGKKPQMGFAGKDKRAWLWLPSKGALNQKASSIMESAPIKGCTQLAYEDWFKPMEGQSCEICWVGLDIDQDDNEGIDLSKWGIEFAKKQKASLVRLSCSGQGLHMIWKLSEPLLCNRQTAGWGVKNLARPFKEAAESEGIHVCQANRRMFWLVGAKNDTIYSSDDELDINNRANLLKEGVSLTKNITVGFKKLEVTEKVQKWIDIFRKGSVLSEFYSRNNPIYVGYAVKCLQKAGETIYTKSNCSGDGKINGYLDITNTKISLWAYADGHTIWCYEVIGALIQ